MVRKIIRDLVLAILIAGGSIAIAIEFVLIFCNFSPSACAEMGGLGMVGFSSVVVLPVASTLFLLASLKFVYKIRLTLLKILGFTGVTFLINFIFIAIYANNDIGLLFPVIADYVLLSTISRYASTHS